MGISAGDLVLLQGEGQLLDVYVNRWPLQSVATATIDQTTFNYPIAEITVNNTSANWLTATMKGQMVRVTAADLSITVGVVRKTPTATTLYIDAKHKGDPGRAQTISNILSNAQTVTIYDYMPPWTMFSDIRDGIFYKEWDLTFSNQGTDPEPVCNMGAWRQAFVDSGGTATLAFDASGSYDWTGVSLSYLWELPASGATLDSGTLTSSSIGVEFDPGFYLMKCTVSNATTTRTGIRPVWVNTTTGADAPYSLSNNVQIGGDRQGLQGRGVSFQFAGTLTETDFMDGGAVILSDYATYAGSTLETATEYVGTYVGIITEMVREGTLAKPTLSVETQSPFMLLSQLPCPPQVIWEAATPVNWTEVETGLATPSFIIWYLMHYHCYNALTLFDYYKLPDVTPVRKTRWTSSADNLQAQVSEIATSVSGNIGSASDGSYYFLRNPNVEDTTYRNAMDVKMVITETHLRERIRYPIVYRPQIGEYTAYGWRMDGADLEALTSIVGKGAQGQGITKTQGATLLVSTQAGLNKMAGNLMALGNNPTPEVQFLINRNIDVFDPARDLDKWFNTNIDAVYDPRNVGFTDATTIKSVEREWRMIKGAPLKDITLSVQPETQGTEGVTETRALWPGTQEGGIVWGYNALGSPYTLNFQIDENGVLEWSPSGGGDFVDVGPVEGEDGQSDILETPDPVPVADRPGGEDWPCISAGNVVEYVKAYKAALVDAITNAADTLDFRQRLAAPLAAVLGVGNNYNDLLIAHTNDWFGGSAATINAAFSASFYDSIEELIYCQMNNDGQLDFTSFNDLLDDLNLTDTAWYITYDLIATLGIGGTNTVAQIMGLVTNNCAAYTCDEWTHTFLFDTESGSAPNTSYGNGGWVQDGIGESWYDGATRTPSVGWEDINSNSITDPTNDWRRVISIARTFASTTITNVSITYDMDAGEDPLARGWHTTDIPGSNLIFSSALTGSDITASDSTYVTITKLILFLIVDAETSEAALDANDKSCTLKSCTITGRGTDPF